MNRSISEAAPRRPAVRRTRASPAALAGAAFIALLAALPPAAAPSAAAASPAPARGALDLGTRVFTIRHKNTDDVYVLISPHLGPRGSVRAQPHQRTLEVTDTPATLQRIARVIEAYDIPPRSVRVAVQLIMATAGPGSPEPAPPPIRGVIEKLNALNTRWNDYRLVGDARVMGTEGEGSTMRIGEDYRVAFRIDEISDESRLIRFKPFELQRRDPVVEDTERYASIMNTVLNLRDSQLFIVGASKMEQSNRAIFMTITASVEQP